MAYTEYPGGLGMTNGDWQTAIDAIGAGDLAERIASCLTDDPRRYCEIDLDADDLAAVEAALA